MAEHHVSVKLRCRSGHEHDMCYQVKFEVPKELRCPGSGGYSMGGGGGCPLPPDLENLIWRALHADLQEHRRNRFVLVAL